jgi:hypothetical protein
MVTLPDIKLLVMMAVQGGEHSNEIPIVLWFFVSFLIVK